MLINGNVKSREIKRVAFDTYFVIWRKNFFGKKAMQNYPVLQFVNKGMLYNYIFLNFIYSNLVTRSKKLLPLFQWNLYVSQWPPTISWKGQACKFTGKTGLPRSSYSGWALRNINNSLAQRELYNKRQVWHVILLLI